MLSAFALSALNQTWPYCACGFPKPRSTSTCVVRAEGHIIEFELPLCVIGLDPAKFGTHSLRRTTAVLIYSRTGNLRAVQLLLGHSKIESTGLPDTAISIPSVVLLTEATLTHIPETTVGWDVGNLQGNLGVPHSIAGGDHALRVEY